MREIHPTSRLHELLVCYSALGGVIDHVLVALDGSLGTSLESHRRTGLFTLEAIKRRTDEFAEKMLKRDKFQGLKREDFFSVSINETKMLGEEISLQEFLGPMFDLSTRRLLMRGETNHHLNDYFWAGDKEEQHHIQAFPVSPQCNFATNGYAHAFTDPPHGLGGTAQEINQLFLDLAAELFQGFNDPCTIWRWSTDCSNYFESGLEWWGSYLWTVHTYGSQVIVGIAASTTD